MNGACAGGHSRLCSGPSLPRLLPPPPVRSPRVPSSPPSPPRPLSACRDLRKNHGKEEARARDLFYALWIPDLFMKRVEVRALYRGRGAKAVYSDKQRRGPDHFMKRVEVRGLLRGRGAKATKGSWGKGYVGVVGQRLTYSDSSSIVGASTTAGKRDPRGRCGRAVRFVGQRRSKPRSSSAGAVWCRAALACGASGLAPHTPCSRFPSRSAPPPPLSPLHHALLAPLCRASLHAHSLTASPCFHPISPAPQANEEWSLFCPNESPGLADCWGDAFEELYTKCVEMLFPILRILHKVQTTWACRRCPRVMPALPTPAGSPPAAAPAPPLNTGRHRAPCPVEREPEPKCRQPCRYEREGRARKTIKAQQLWFAVLEAQVGRLGVPAGRGAGMGRRQQDSSPEHLSHSLHAAAARSR